MKPYQFISLVLLICLTACSPSSPAVTPTATIGLPTPTANGATATATVEPTATDSYRLGPGGPITPEMLNQIKVEDPTVAKQITWLVDQWGPWYGSFDSSIRPMTADEAKKDLVFYKWVDSNGKNHYKVAWNLPGYEGFIVLPPAYAWANLNPPDTSDPAAASEGHGIGEGQGIVKISVTCTEGSDLAKMGVPVGAQLTPEQGTGDWVMMFQGNVVARIDKAGVWQLEAPQVDYTPYLNKPQTTAEFLPGQESYIPDILAKLRAGPSFLTDGSPAPERGRIVNSSSGAHFAVDCNKGGVINCAPAAFMQITRQNVKINIIFLEIRNEDGSRGYKVAYYSDSSKINTYNSYGLFVDHPNDPMELIFITNIGAGYTDEYSDAMFIFQQPGFVQNDQAWIDTGNIPQSSEGQIELMYN